MIFLFFAFISGLFTIVSCGGGGGGDSTVHTAFGTGTIQVDFGNVVLDHFSVETITLQNNGNSTGELGQIDLTQLNPPFSIIKDTCSGNKFAPSESCTIEVRFEPATVQGAYSDDFIIPGVTGGVCRTVYVSGNALAFNLSINQVDTANCPSTINLYVSVTDKDDNPVTGLNQSNFTLLENNILIDENPNDPNQNYLNFSNTVSGPLSAALALDQSGSIQAFTADVQTAAKSFITNLSDTDEAEIIKFAESVMVMAGFTSDKIVLEQAIDEDPQLDTSKTLLYDATWRAIEDTSIRNNRRAVILLSDGNDEVSVDHTLDDVVNHSSNKGVPIFTVGLGNIFTPVMQYLADTTGGQYFQAPTSSELKSIYDRISNLLSNQYLIEYSTNSCGAGTITLNLSVDLNGDYGEDSTSVVFP